MAWYWIVLICMYLVVNSFLFAVYSSNTILEAKEMLVDWLLHQFFGIPLVIFYSIPKWYWFYDNVLFWFDLWFTDKYKDLDRSVIENIRKYNSGTPQFKAMQKKYGY